MNNAHGRFQPWEWVSWDPGCPQIPVLPAPPRHRKDMLTPDDPKDKLAEVLEEVMTRHESCHWLKSVVLNTTLHFFHRKTMKGYSVFFLNNTSSIPVPFSNLQASVYRVYTLNIFLHMFAFDFLGWSKQRQVLNTLGVAGGNWKSPGRRMEFWSPRWAHRNL